MLKHYNSPTLTFYILLLANCTKWDYSILLYNLGKLVKRGGGVLPNVINLQRMLGLPGTLVLIENPPPCSYNNLLWKKKENSKIESKKWVSHRDSVECSRLLTRLRLTLYGHRFTVLRNEVSDTDSSTLNYCRWQETLNGVNGQTVILFLKQRPPTWRA